MGQARTLSPLPLSRCVPMSGRAHMHACACRLPMRVARLRRPCCSTGACAWISWPVRRLSCWAGAPMRPARTSGRASCPWSRNAMWSARPPAPCRPESRPPTSRCASTPDPVITARADRCSGAWASAASGGRGGSGEGLSRAAHVAGAAEEGGRQGGERGQGGCGCGGRQAGGAGGAPGQPLRAAGRHPGRPSSG